MSSREISLNPLSRVNCILMEKYYYFSDPASRSQSPKSGQLHSNEKHLITPK